MDIGKEEKESITIEPLFDPVPREEPLVPEREIEEEEEEVLVPA